MTDTTTIHDSKHKATDMDDAQTRILIADSFQPEGLDALEAMGCATTFEPGCTADALPAMLARCARPLAPRSLRALLLCWLPAALRHWRRAQRALASELSSGMPDEHDTALHSTREQPIRPINLARAGADGPEPRRQVHLHCVLRALPAIVGSAHGG